MRRWLAIASLVAWVATALPVGAQTDLRVPAEVSNAITNGKERTVYIVQMLADPVVAYDGGVAGIPPTEPGNGRKVDPDSPDVKKYVAHLDRTHGQAAASVKAEVVYHYRYSFNGFAALMTGAEASALRSRADILGVWLDEFREPVTDNSPDFLGLTDAVGGLWADQGLSGEDVIVGVIDTGIWPEHPSFSDQADLSDGPGQSGSRTLVYGPPPSSWHGICQAGEQWSQQDCNNKLIGARYFKDGFTNHDIKISGDYLSTRDADGHGTHTASTAAGNADVPASVFGVDRGTISGIAPRARVASYKACWANAGCAVSDLTAAIDQAIADGVDVINYSIGGGSTGLLDADSVAFLFAASAGVRVATSAGNSGPGASTIGNPAVVPWLTTVGASTQNRTFQGSAELGSGETFLGASITGSTDGPLPLVDSVDAGSELCLPSELDSSVVAGKVVLCKRGVIARVDKSLAVHLAGGLGTILYNENDGQTLNTDNHWTPTVHISFSEGQAIKAYIAGGAGATAAIFGGEFTPIPAPWMADFSSRGPNAGAFDIIKPDMTAPGVNILAGNTPTPFLGAPDQLFQAISGTSMSSPHVAGLFALLAEAHPEWSPAATKSALMTTANPSVMKENGSTPGDPFDFGAGHVDPNPAIDPGLVYDASLLDYVGFLCGAGAVSNATCNAFGISPIDPSDLNLPSIGVAELAGSQTVTRTVTNVGPAGTYDASVVVPAGIDVVVSPNSLILDSGESAAYDITFTTTVDAVLDEWAFGALTWSDGTRSVRSPIAVVPVAVAAPAEVTGEGADGSLEFQVAFGYDGEYTPEPLGLVAADMQPGNVVDDPANDINTALSTGVGVTFHQMEIPVDTVHARFSLFDDYTDGNDDLDLYVFGPASDGFPFVGGSGSPTSQEQVDVASPKPGAYIVVVHGWQTDGPDANYTLFSWPVPNESSGNMTVVDPGDAVLGETATVTVNWTGLEANQKHMGAVRHANPTDSEPLTFVRIDTD